MCWINSLIDKYERSKIKNLAYDWKVKLSRLLSKKRRNKNRIKKRRDW